MNTMTRLMFSFVLVCSVATAVGCGFDNGEEDGGSEADVGTTPDTASDGSGSAGCVDEDGDGYGSPANETFENCLACEQERPNGCQPDCLDDPAEAPEGVAADDVNPGAVERCNGVDDNCDKTDDQPGVEACAGNPGDSECPLAEANVPVPQEGTSWTCASVDGQPQCILQGDFDGSESCQQVDQTDDRWGFCESGQWTEVAEACTTSG